MTTVSGLLTILCLLGGAQGLLLASALASVRRGNITANRLLAALIFVVSIFVFGAVVRTTGYELTVPHLSRLHDPFPFLAGPLLFLYLRTLADKEAKIVKKDFLHLIPFGIFVLYSLPFYLQSSASKYEILFSETHQDNLGAYYYVRSIMVITHFLIYLFLSVWMIGGHWHELKETNSSRDKNVLNQVRFLLAASGAVLIFSIFRFTLDHTASTNLLIPLLIAAIVYGLGYVCLIKPEVVIGIGESRQPNQLALPEPQILQPPVPKYEKSTLTPERAERYLKKLLRAMDEEKLYLDCELTIPELAARLSIPPQHLSQIINERMNQSFSDFINAYRIEEVKKLLLDPAKKHYSILAIAEEAGFNSKSSFNAVFKKLTNQTPSEFRKSATNGSEKL